MKKILYIQHATALGGSVLSLLYLIQRLDRARYSPMVACVGAGTDIPAFYQAHGVEAFPCPTLDVFPHTTGGWFPLYNPRALIQLAARLTHFRPTVAETQRMIARLRPDLVHLNSVVLGPCAIGAAKAGVPIVWHVREAVVRGDLGFRRSLIRRWLLRLPAEIIFISSDEKRQLLQDQCGVVIPNFVDFERFNPQLDGGPCRRELGLSPADQVVLFLGGLGEIKGILPFLESLSLERARNPRLRALIAGGVSAHLSGWLADSARFILPRIGLPTVRQRATALMQHHQMHSYVQLLPFRPDVEQLLAACDLLAFPSIEPHFARPVIEAGAMAKPVVASRIGGVEELVEHGQTGWLVPPGGSPALAYAIHQLLSHPQEAARLGRNGYERARRLYDGATNAGKTMEVYDQIFSRQS